MSIKFGSNRFIPRPASGGESLWQLYGANVVGLVDLANKVAIGTNAMLSDEELRVAGGIAATPTGAGNDAFVQVGAGSALALSGANSFRLIYNSGTGQAEISTNGGAFVPLGGGGVSPWQEAAGVITEVNPASLVVVGSAASLNADQFQVLGNALVRASVDSNATFQVQDAATSTRFQVDTVNNAAVVTGSYQMIGPAAEVYLESQPSTAPNSAVNQGRIRYNNAGTPSWQGSVNGGAYSDFITAATLPTVAFVQNGNTFGADAVLGTNDAFALQFETSGVTRGRFTSTGAFLVAAAAAAGTESLRVTGGGILNDGTQHTVSVTSTLAINNSGGAINIGNNADAQAINIGTGAAARTITLGNSTGATSLVLDAGTGPISIGTSNFARTTSIATGAAVQSVTIGSTTANSSITLQANTGAITMQTLAGTDFILIGTTASARTVNIATGGAAQSVTVGSSTGASSLNLNAGTGPISIGASASARTTSIATGAAAQTINIGTTNTTSSIANSFGTSGFGLIQGAATSGTPIGVLMTAGAHTGLSIAEATDVNFNLARTVTFGAGGGTLATQRAYRVQGPTYAAAAALTITDIATLAVGLPTPGANVTLSTGATGPTMPTDSGTAGGAYSLTQTPAVRIEGITANTTLGVSMILRNTASNATAFPMIGWQSNAGALDGAIGFQTGNAFNHQRFLLAVRANGILAPSLTISSQGGYRFLNSAPNDPATTPAGFLFTGTANGAVNTYTASVEANQFTIASNQTYTFATGAISVQRSTYIQAPTYAFSAASTVTDAATLAINAAPTAGANATFTRSMAIWVQAGVSRFDGGVGVKVTPGGTAVQGLGADFRKTNNPGSVSYPNGVSVIAGGSYTPATGYLSIIPAFWTLPQAINSGGGVGPPLNPGIRFNWSDGTTTIRYNTNTAASLTETRDTIDFNKDGLTIVSVDFIVDNTSGGASTQDFNAWTLDGNQF